MKESLKKLCTIQVGGTCEEVVFCKTAKQLKQEIEKKRNKNEKFVVVGQGSNVVFKDGHHNVCVLCTKFMKNVKVGKFLYADCGVSLIELCKIAKEHSLSGLEFAYGIPGTVGGAVFMNAGAFGGCMGDVVCKVKLSRGNKVVYKTNTQMQFAYRHSYLKECDDIILGVYLCLKKGKSKDIEKEYKQNMQKRIASQPLGTKNFGSVFKTTQGVVAGKAIDELQLKGKEIGGVKISTKHANFFENFNNASCSDVEKLIDFSKQEVFKKTKVMLEEEVVFLPK